MADGPRHGETDRPAAGQNGGWMDRRMMVRRLVLLMGGQTDGLTQ